jgi:hypothetical protein
MGQEREILELGVHAVTEQGAKADALFDEAVEVGLTFPPGPTAPRPSAEWPYSDRRRW